MSDMYVSYLINQSINQSVIFLVASCCHP